MHDATDTRLSAALIAAALVLLPVPVCAGDAPSPQPAETPPFVSKTVDAYTLRPGHLIDEVETVEARIGNEAAARELSEQTIDVNEFYSEVKVLEAATLKADGRRLDVPPSGVVSKLKPTTYTENTSIHGEEERQITITFPDLTSGDRIRYVISRIAKRQAEPGGAARAVAINPAINMESYTVTLDAPADAPLHFAQKHFSHAVDNRDGRALHTWTMHSQQARPTEPNEESPFDAGPFVKFSSFPDWPTAAQAFCKRADPLIAVTPEIAKLANEITKGRTGPREQAETILDWVANNIRYLSITLGTGGLVPRPVSSVLTNRYGDCKDHATLMRTLLAAKGVASDYALVNTLNIYAESEVPARQFNHVIVYIPGLDLYIDPTDHNSKLGGLHEGLRGKPVLRCGHSQGVSSRIPLTTDEADGVDVTATLTVAPNGKISGEAITRASGAPSASLRSYVKSLQSTQPGAKDELSKQLLAASGTRGSAEIASQDFSARGNATSATVEFSTDDIVLGPDSARIALTGPSLIDKPFNAYGGKFDADRKTSFICLPSSYSENLTYALPSGWTPENLPKDVNVRGGVAEFSARYHLRDGALKIERRFDLRPLAPVCPASMARDVAPVFNAAIRDSERRLTFAAADPAAVDRLSSALRSEAAANPETVSPISETSDAKVTVRSDGLLDMVVVQEAMANDDEGAKSMANQSVRVDDFSDTEIIEAATLKADGRRINVPADKIFTRSFQANTQMRQIVFPDVAKGDRVRYVFSQKQKKPPTPGGFSIARSIYAASNPTAVSMSLDAPATLKLHVAHSKFSQSVSEKNSRILYEWRLPAQQDRPGSFDELFVFKPVAWVSVSSYPSWTAAGTAYCGPAQAAAASTEETARLAREITEGKTSRYDQAKAIFDWLTANIVNDDTTQTSTGLTPNAPATTLAKRKGTQQDAAALMLALLKEKNIESYLALTSSGPAQAPEITDQPALDFSGTAVHLPEFGLYARPSDKLAVFGEIGTSDYGGRILRCGPGAPEMTHYKAASAETNAATVKTELTIGPDGKASGETIITTRGGTAYALRKFMSTLKETGTEATMAAQFRSLGLRGSATAETVPSTQAPQADVEGAIKVAFSVTDSLLGEDNAQRVVTGPRVVGRQFQLYAANLRPGRPGLFYCYPAAYRETIVYRLPSGWQAKDLPKDVNIARGPASFTAHYKSNGDRLEIDRDFVLRTDGQPCAESMAEDIYPVASATERDWKEKLVFVKAETTKNPQ